MRMLSPAGARFTFSDIVITGFKFLFAKHGVVKLREQIKAYFGIRHAFAVNSGRTALAVILGALRDGSVRNEIIIPSYTCFSVPAAIQRAGLKARLVDLNPDSLSYNTQQLASSISDKTLAILLIYPFNLGTDPSEIFALAKKHGITVIEDVAQSMGLTVGGSYAGTISDIGFFSLSKGKAITSIRGGLIITNHESLASKIDSLVHTLPPAGIIGNLKLRVEAKLIWLFLRPWLFGVIARSPFLKLGETSYWPNFRMTQMPRAAAHLASRMLIRLEIINKERKERAEKLLNALQPDIRALALTGDFNEKSLYLRLPIVCPSKEVRDKLCAQLFELGGSSMYKRPLSVIEDKEVFAGEHATEKFPNGQRIADCLLTLPTHGFVTDSDISRIAAILNRELGSSIRR